MDWITSIRDIKKAQENNQLVIFVGAGVSKNSQVPTWWELIKKIAGEIKYDRCETCTCRDKGKVCPDENCSNRYNFTQDEFLRIPEYFYQQHKESGDDTYYDLIQSTLRGGTGPNSINEEIFNLLPHHIITTNYDSLLEDSNAANVKLYEVVSKDSDLLSKANDRYIIKMHGDLGLKDTIVLKESDYIDYEQKHPLISTFIRSLLVNHTFVFLGYSLNDYNLNLIIGWINYFRKIHGIEKRPVNYLIDSKPASELEKSRLEDKSIYVVDLNSLPAEIEQDITIPNDITDPIGKKLFLFLRCITSPKIIQKYISLEELLEEKYKTLEPYSKISFQDLISVHPLGRTEFIGSELVFYEKESYDKISEILNNPDSFVTKTFCKAGISAIHFYDDNSSKEVPNAYEPVDETLQLYFDNDYVQLEDKLHSSSGLLQKLYYFHFLGKRKDEINEIIQQLNEKFPAKNHVEVILQKTRMRCAVLTFFDRQEERTRELQLIFDTTPEKWRKATSFLRMLFESAAVNMHKMEGLLEKIEKRYEYNNNTLYSEHAHLSLWKLKSYVYDYYFFFLENNIPLHYFSNPKDYFSYYLKAILCTYSPSPKNSQSGFLKFRREQPNYVFNEIDLDLFVKYSDPKKLKLWLEKYSVQKLFIDSGIDIVKKFSKLCESMTHYKVTHWTNHIHCFCILLSLIDLDVERKKNIVKSISDMVKEVSIEAPVFVDNVFESIDYISHHFSVEDCNKEFTRLVENLLSPNCISVLLERRSWKLQMVLKRLSSCIGSETKEHISKELSSIDNTKELCNKSYVLRHALPIDFLTELFKSNVELLSVEQIFYLLTENILEFDERCLLRIINIMEGEINYKKQHPGVVKDHDELIYAINQAIILKLLGFNIELSKLEPYVEYSKHLQFIIDPDNFDYSSLDTSDYMWQNLIYSREYKHYFVEHKDSIITQDLKKLFEMKVETVDQRKIAYGILLDDIELQRF